MSRHTTRLVELTQARAAAFIVAAAGELGSFVSSLRRCPGCRGIRLQRRLALCHGGGTFSAWRARVYSTGCRRCGLLFISPMPPQRYLQSMYGAGGRWDQTHPSVDASREVGDSLLRPLDDLTGLLSGPPGRKMLDIGCGKGRWLNSFAQAGWLTYGIEPATKVAFRRHQELTAIPADRTFDFVVLNHVLEHLPEPGSILRQAAAATAPGGWIFISVPRVETLPEHGDWNYVLNAGAHLTAYTLDALTTLLTMTGWGDVRVVDGPKAGKRLAIVARRGAPGRLPDAPLASALTALAEGSRAGAITGKFVVRQLSSRA
jgi:SAM-dependent methyltransferase